jgi:hypothetical protein
MKSKTKPKPGTLYKLKHNEWFFNEKETGTQFQIKKDSIILFVKQKDENLFQFLKNGEFVYIDFFSSLRFEEVQ